MTEKSDKNWYQGQIATLSLQGKYAKTLISKDKSFDSNVIDSMANMIYAGFKELSVDIFIYHSYFLEVINLLKGAVTEVTELSFPNFFER